MRIVLIGPPGVGMGTQARVLAERLSIPAISSGDLFRAQISGGTELGRTLKRYTDAGDLVPDELTTTIIMSRLNQADTAGGFLLDGFPRTVHQADLLGQAVSEQGTGINLAIAFDLPDEQLVQRLTGRRGCPTCGTTVHILHSPPHVPERCNDCGDGLTRREDDTEATVLRRLAIFREQAEPLLRWYGDRQLLFRVDAAGSVRTASDRIQAGMPSNGQ
jgi:adenylate kinase